MRGNVAMPLGEHYGHVDAKNFPQRLHELQPSHSMPQIGYHQDNPNAFPVQPRQAWPPGNDRAPVKLPPIEFSNVNDQRQSLPPLPDNQANFVGFRMLEGRVQYIEQRLAQAERIATEANRSAEAQGQRAAMLTADLARSNAEANQLKAGLTGLASELRGAEVRLNGAMAALAEASRVGPELKAQMAMLGEEVARGNAERANMSAAMERMAHQFAMTTEMSVDQSRRALQEAHAAFCEDARNRQAAHMAELGALGREIEAFRMEASNAGMSLQSAVQQLNARVASESATIDRIRAETAAISASEGAQIASLRAQLGEINASLGGLHQQVQAEQHLRRLDASAFQANLQAMEAAARSVQESAIKRLTAAMEAKGRELTMAIMDIDGRLADQVEDARNIGDAQAGALVRAAARSEKVSQERLLILESALRDMAAQSAAALAELQSKVDKGVLSITMAGESSRNITEDREAALREQINAALNKLRTYTRDMEESLDQERLRLEEVVKLEIKARKTSTAVFQEELATMRRQLEKMGVGTGGTPAIRQDVLTDVNDILETNKRDQEEALERKFDEFKGELNDLVQQSKKDQDKQRDAKLQELKRELLNAVVEATTSTSTFQGETSEELAVLKKEMKEALASATRQMTAAVSGQERLLREAEDRMRERIREHESRIMDMRKRPDQNASSSYASNPVAASSTFDALDDRDSSMRAFKEMIQDRLSKASAATAIALTEQNASLQAAKREWQDRLSQLSTSTYTALTEQDARLKDAKQELHEAIASLTGAAPAKQLYHTADGKPLYSFSNQSSFAPGSMQRSVPAGQLPSAAFSSYGQANSELSELKAWFDRNQVDAKLAEEALKLELDLLSSTHQALEDKVSGLTSQLLVLEQRQAEESNQRAEIQELVDAHNRTITHVASKVNVLDKPQSTIAIETGEKLEAALRNMERQLRSEKAEVDARLSTGLDSLGALHKSIKKDFTILVDSQHATLADLTRKHGSEFRDLEKHLTDRLAAAMADLDRQGRGTEERISKVLSNTVQDAVEGLAHRMDVTSREIEECRTTAAEHSQELSRLLEDMSEALEAMTELKEGAAALETGQIKATEHLQSLGQTVGSLGELVEELERGMTKLQDEVASSATDVKSALDANTSRLRTEAAQQISELRQEMEAMDRQLHMSLDGQVAGVRTETAQKLQSGLDGIRMEADMRAAALRSEAETKLAAAVTSLERKVDASLSLEEARTNQLVATARDVALESMDSKIATMTQVVRKEIDERIKAIADSVQGDLEGRVTAAVDSIESEVDKKVAASKAALQSELEGKMQADKMDVNEAMDIKQATTAAVIRREVTSKLDALRSELGKNPATEPSTSTVGTGQILPEDIDQKIDRRVSLVIADVEQKLKAGVAEIFMEADKKMSAGMANMRAEAAQNVPSTRSTAAVADSDLEAKLVAAVSLMRKEVDEKLGTKEASIRAAIIAALSGQLAQLRNDVEDLQSSQAVTNNSETGLRSDQKSERQAAELRAEISRLKAEVVEKVAQGLAAVKAETEKKSTEGEKTQTADKAVAEVAAVRSELAALRVHTSKLTDEIAGMLAEVDGKLANESSNVRLEAGRKLAAEINALRSEVDEKLLGFVHSAGEAASSALHSLEKKQADELAAVQAEVERKLAADHADLEKRLEQLKEAVKVLEAQAQMNQSALKDGPMAAYASVMPEVERQLARKLSSMQMSDMQGLVGKPKGFDQQMVSEGGQLPIEQHAAKLAVCEKEVQGLRAVVDGPEGLQSKMTQVSKKLDDTSRRLSGLKSEVVHEMNGLVGQKVEEAIQKLKKENEQATS